MPFSYINYYDYYKPSYNISVNEILNEINDTQKNKNYISKYSNLDEISLELKLNQFEMYTKMMEKYFSSHNPEDIKYLIFTGENYFINSGMSVPYYLLGKYGLKNATIIAIDQFCTGTPQAMQIADCMIKSNPKIKVMIVSLSRKNNIQDRYNWPTIIGDGAGIMVLGSEGFLKIIDYNSWSDGSVSLKRCTNFMNTEMKIPPKRLNIIMLNNRKTVLDLLMNNNLNVNDIHMFIPLNVHHLIYRMHAKALKVGINKFFLDNIPCGGHLGDVDSIRNLKDAIAKYHGNSNSKYVLFTLGDSGGNISYNAVLIESC